MSEHQISDAELTGFLDGELSAADRERIAARLGSDPELARRLEALKIDKAAVANAFALLSVRDAPKPAPAPAPRRRSARMVAMAASLALAVLAGVLVGRTLRPGPEALDWRELAAAYHALYVTDTLARVRTDPEQVERALARAEAALGRPIPRRLTRLPGLDFKRVQLLGHDGAAVIQIAYLDAAGSPVALCLHAAEAAPGTDAQPRELRFAGVRGIAWHNDGVEYLLLGKGRADGLEALAAAAIELAQSDS
ncbi:MAG: hypothetical protein D6754_09570 [Alphaproteobacteria bacterium]|nr:MAG: hypothetical protein D6754_09570 [Alphaproteobacteria bacterium]